jgi:hypothetical protein
MSKGKPQQRKRAQAGAAKQPVKKPLWRKPVVWLGGAATTVITGVLTGLLVNLLGTQTQQVIASPSSVLTAPTSIRSHTSQASPRQITSPSPSPSSGGPLSVVSEDPINLDNAGVWVFPQKMVLTPSQLKTLNTPMDINHPAANIYTFMNLLFSLGGYQTSTDTQLVVQNNQAQEVRVLDMNVVKSCQAPLTGTLVYSPNAGGDPTIQVGFDLDSASTEAETWDTWAVRKPGYFAGHTVSIQPGAQQVFNIRTATSKHSCSFRFLLTLLVGSKKTYQLIGNGSQPFRISALVETNGNGPDYSAYGVMYAGGVASPLSADFHAG